MCDEQCCDVAFAQVEAVTPLTVLELGRKTFLNVLGPLEALLTREKSPQVRAVCTTGFQMQAVGEPDQADANLF